MPLIRFLTLAFVSVLLLGVAVAAPVRPKVIGEDLSDALGFFIYRFEAQLGPNEVMVIRSTETAANEFLEIETAMVNPGRLARYEISVIDSGTYHPSLRGTYMLRTPENHSYVEGVMLSHRSSDESSVELIFNIFGTNTRKRSFKWTVTVEDYHDVVKRWPELDKLNPKLGFTSSRVLSPISRPKPKSK